MAKTALATIPPAADQPRRTFLRAAGAAGLMAALPTRTDAQAQDKPAEQVFDLGNFVLRSGATLREAKLAYETHGTLTWDKSNAIAFPTP